ncbi:MAG: bifunctional diaminohydroxyphosphoribosylaminopyrimidine deaminase/5-amino-6-(5-phosphoribosylamino)uracil reductase RibD [Candidatus Omnitrophica bacterium]|nr:bifunctional diaminohydroxyphosphoribosylaminopyrimidine deaminase/5-amino-6-(5-phosphoribosylamino)uracil reductase RibD [Candidatus Omnitrophota bacterium]
MLQKDDVRFMKLAKNLALKGMGNTNPNPVVGCVIVKEGRLVARGYHRKAGLPHAEIEAIREAQKKNINLRGTTMYVNLEPCTHFGKTPPCVKTIIDSGIKRVIIGMRDPNPINNGRGIRILRRSGVSVEIGVMEEELRKINLPFIKFMKRGLPYITVKVAESLDGKIATRTLDSKWITNEDSRSFANRLRGYVDAILVGANTVIFDNPLLTNRSKNNPLRQPLKIILDERLKVPLDSDIFSYKSPSKSIIATTKKLPLNKMGTFLKQKNIEVLFCKRKSGFVDLKDLLRKLAEKGIMHILVEGGGQTIASFFKEGLVDEVYFFIAPKIIGGKDAPTSVEGDGIRKLEAAISLKDIDIKHFGDDILIHGRIKNNV